MDDRLLTLIQRLGIRTDSDCQRASDELRRLAAVEAEVEALRKALEIALNHLEPMRRAVAREAIDAAEAALAARPGGEG